MTDMSVNLEEINQLGKREKFTHANKLSKLIIGSC